jgi:hypothetical protein
MRLCFCCDVAFKKKETVSLVITREEMGGTNEIDLRDSVAGQDSRAMQSDTCGKEKAGAWIHDTLGGGMAIWR